MSSRPLKIPGHRPLSRPEDRDRPFSGQRSDPRLGPPARCLSRPRVRGGGGGSAQPQVKEAVVAREVALRRLRRTAEVHAEMRQPLAEVKRELIDVLLHLRIHSLEVVESIERWRSTGNRAGAPWADPGSGENYLLKMKTDTQWLADSPLDDILTFSPKSDPFFVVPAARETAAQPASNQMTPTLQARRQQRGDRRKAVLPLQASLLKRIHKAELVILKESVQARVAAAAASAPRAGAYRSDEPVVAEAVSRPLSGDRPKQVPASADVQVAREPPRQSSLITTSRRLISRTPVDLLPADAPFVLTPMAATEASFGSAVDQYFARVDPRVLQSLETRQTLEALAGADEGRGPEALEFFWLFKASRADVAEALAKQDNAAKEADGLVVFRLKKTSVPFGQILHFSLATEGEPMQKDSYLEALGTVKNYMFACLPIKNLRITLWYFKQPDEKINAFKDLMEVFQKTFFKWFQLTNMPDGRRGQVINRPRGTPDDGDPLLPEDVPSIRICWGQVWLRGGAMHGALGTRRIGSSAWNLALSALCFHQFWSQDASEVAKRHTWDVAAADAAKPVAREGLVKALIKGELPKLLARLTPAPLLLQSSDPLAAGFSKSYASRGTQVALSQHLGKSMASSGGKVPWSHCEVADAADDLVQRLSTGAGFAEACEGLEVEGLSTFVANVRPKDAAFGRMFASMDWHGVRALDAETFEVPLLAVGKCPNHPHQICYVPTTEDDVFVVIIPWAGVGDVPSDEAAFTACTEIYRASEPLEALPFPAIQLKSFSAAAPVRTTEIEDPRALGFTDSAALHAAEFGSLIVSPGRDMPGRLLPSPLAPGSTPPMVVEKPYILGFWHTALEALNVPLAATVVA